MAGFDVTLYGRFWVTPEVRGTVHPRNHVRDEFDRASDTREDQDSRVRQPASPTPAPTPVATAFPWSSSVAQQLDQPGAEAPHDDSAPDKAGSASYFGQPSFFTSGAGTSCRPVTPAGMAAPPGTIHTSTRRN